MARIAAVVGVGERDLGAGRDRVGEAAGRRERDRDRPEEAARGAIAVADAAPVGLGHEALERREAADAEHDEVALLARGDAQRGQTRGPGASPRRGRRLQERAASAPLLRAVGPVPACPLLRQCAILGNRSSAGQLRCSDPPIRPPDHSLARRLDDPSTAAYFPRSGAVCYPDCLEEVPMENLKRPDESRRSFLTGVAGAGALAALGEAYPARGARAGFGRPICSRGNVQQRGNQGGEGAGDAVSLRAAAHRQRAGARARFRLHADDRMFVRNNLLTPDSTSAQPPPDGQGPGEQGTDVLLDELKKASRRYPAGHAGMRRLGTHRTTCPRRAARPGRRPAAWVARSGPGCGWRDVLKAAGVKPTPRMSPARAAISA